MIPLRLSCFLILLLGLVGVASGEEKSRADRIRAAIADPESGAVLIAAHRGGYATDRKDEAPENSIANVDIAVARGFDLYETDIRRTRDGVFVVVHDDTLDRETTGTGPVENLDFAEVENLQKRYRDGSLSTEKVATLEALLKAGKGKLLFKADLKPGVIEHFDDLAALIDRLGMNRDVFLRTSLKDAKTIKEAFSRGVPRVEIMFKVDRAEQVAKVVSDFSPQTIQVNFEKGEALTREKMVTIHKATSAGICVETHSYSDPETWETLIESGVRMLHTALPDKTLEHLQKTGRRSGLDATR